MKLLAIFGLALLAGCTSEPGYWDHGVRGANQDDTFRDDVGECYVNAKLIAARNADSEFDACMAAQGYEWVEGERPPETFVASNA